MTVLPVLDAAGLTTDPGGIGFLSFCAMGTSLRSAAPSTPYANTVASDRRSDRGRHE